MCFRPATFAVSLSAFLADVPEWLWLALLGAMVIALAGIVYRLERAVRYRRRAEEAYRLLFEDASDAIAVLSPELDILDVNSQACAVFGYSREELLRIKVADLIPEQELASRMAGLREAVAKGDTILQERRFLRKDSASIVAEVSVRKLRDGRLIAIGRDVTARHAAEEALKQSEAIARSVVYTAVDGIITAGENGLIESFNPAAERLFGYQADEAIGQNLSILMPSPESEQHDGYIHRYLAGGEPHIIGLGREVIAKRKDGSLFPIELAVSEMLLPGRRLFTAIVHDITSRKLAQATLQETNATLQAVIQTSPLAVITLDLQGNVQGWNPAAERIFGWTAAEVLQHPIPGVPEGERAEFLASLASKAKREASGPVERRRRRKDGCPIDVNIWTGLLRNPAGEATSVLVVAADVTQRKLVDEQLRHVQKMDAISRLAGGVAHDFNNLLTVISGYGQMVLDRVSTDGELRSHVEEVLQAAERASALASQLLLFGKHRASAFETLDLIRVVAKAEPVLRRIIGDKIELVIAAPEDLGQVRGDATQLEQVLVNLAANARDAMPGGGKLAIEMANVELDSWYTQNHMEIEEGEYVMLAVSDTGVGMTPEDRARAFEPFFTTKERGARAGLGLPTVYGIVRQSGGHIWVYSEPGQGTTFKMYLPREKRPVLQRQPKQDSRAPKPGAETVLLVEDENGVRVLVREILRQSGYRVLEAADGGEALRVCQEHEGKIHLLLTDVVMPVMSGRELAERAGALRPDLRVLYMSGYTDNIVIHHGVDSRQTDFLQKPFTPGVLARKVRDILDRSI